ncbi:hypothetical protein [Pseudonocardia adelaidensis]|uniref:Uncharacterized protein n=1 Tax=Pseudonocardia adelaidensis TaxID=648754 RepID=A0ABP9N6T8_9PSEU
MRSTNELIGGNVADLIATFRDRPRSEASSATKLIDVGYSVWY